MHSVWFIFPSFQPDNILKAMKRIYEQELITSKAAFLDTFDEELQFKPYGNLKIGFTLNEGRHCVPECIQIFMINQFDYLFLLLTLGFIIEGHSRDFVVHYVDHKSDDFEAFAKYLVRMEPFLMYFVDGANFITIDDRWCFYVL